MIDFYKWKYEKLGGLEIKTNLTTYERPSIDTSIEHQPTYTQKSWNFSSIQERLNSLGSITSKSSSKN